jgi:hypothetical protein
MFLAPHYIAPELGPRCPLAAETRTRRVRWTWIAGTRFGGIRWN